MRDPLEDVLGLVAEGRLSPDEAAPIIDALAAARDAADRGRAAADAAGTAGRRTGDAARRAGDAGRFGFDASGGAAGASGPTAASGPPRRLRVQVRDGGRTVIDLQLPGVLAELAGAVPGIPADYAERVREALRSGIRGPIVDVVDDDGSGVTITID